MEKKHIDTLLAETQKAMVRKYPGQSNTRFYMCGERILVKELEIKQIGRIILPQGVVVDDLIKALVVAVGPDVKTIRLGDIIIKVATLGTHLEDEDGKYIQVPENAAIAIDKVATEENNAKK